MPIAEKFHSYLCLPHSYLYTDRHISEVPFPAGEIPSPVRMATNSNLIGSISGSNLGRKNC